MKYLNITNIKSLTPLLDLDFGTINLDVHNLFDCIDIEFNEKSKELIFDFKRNDEITYSEFSEQFCKIVFFETLKIESSFKITDKTKAITLDNFGRGELQENNVYYNNNLIRYFFLGFFEGQFIEVYCSSGIIIFY